MAEVNPPGQVINQKHIDSIINKLLILKKAHRERIAKKINGHEDPLKKELNEFADKILEFFNNLLKKIFSTNNKEEILRYLNDQHYPELGVMLFGEDEKSIVFLANKIKENRQQYVYGSREHGQLGGDLINVMLNIEVYEKLLTWLRKIRA